MKNSIIINGNTLHHGDRITCTISGKYIADARIAILGSSKCVISRVFICQNVVRGFIIKDSLGYNFSYYTEPGGVFDSIKPLYRNNLPIVNLPVVRSYTIINKRTIPDI